MFEDIFKDILGDFEKAKKEIEPKDWDTGKNAGPIWNTGKNESIWKVVNGKKDGIYEVDLTGYLEEEDEEDEDDECAGCNDDCDNCTL